MTHRVKAIGYRAIRRINGYGNDQRNREKLNQKQAFPQSRTFVGFPECGQP
jgi:hypothetical protein